MNDFPKIPTQQTLLRMAWGAVALNVLIMIFDISVQSWIAAAFSVFGIGISLNAVRLIRRKVK